MQTKVRQRAERLSPDRRRAAIIETARQLIRERGYEALNIADIAKAQGVVEGTLYRYFENKDALLLEVVSEWYQQALEDYDAGLLAIANHRDQLRYMIWRHLRMIHDDPDLANLVFLRIRNMKSYRETKVFELNRKYTKRMVNILENAVAKDQLRGDFPVKIARDLIFGGIEHISFAFLRGEGDFSPAAAADAIVDIVYRGVEARSPNVAAEDVLTRFGKIAERIERIVERAAD